MQEADAEEDDDGGGRRQRARDVRRDARQAEREMQANRMRKKDVSVMQLSQSYRPRCPFTPPLAPQAASFGHRFAGLMLHTITAPLCCCCPEEVILLGAWHVVPEPFCKAGLH